MNLRRIWLGFLKRIQFESITCFPPPRRSRCVAGVSSDDRCRYFPFAGWIVNGDERRRLMHPLLSEEKSFTSLSQSIKLMRRRKLGSADATRRWRTEGRVKSVDAAVLNVKRVVSMYIHLCCNVGNYNQPSLILNESWRGWSPVYSQRRAVMHPAVVIVEAWWQQMWFGFHYGGVIVDNMFSTADVWAHESFLKSLNCLIINVLQCIKRTTSTSRLIAAGKQEWR